MEKRNNMSFALNVYSVVNSLCELPGIDNVSITIDGAVLEEGPDGVDLSSPLRLNSDIVKQQETEVETEAETGEVKELDGSKETVKETETDKAQEEKSTEASGGEGTTETETEKK